MTLEVQLFNIPSALRDRPQWLVWRLETRAGQAKPTKVPYDAKTGRHAKSNDPATWGALFQAAQAARDGDYSGIGFAFAEGDGLTGIDLDHVIAPDTGELDPRAAEILDRFAGTYAEVSPSGTGLRIFCFGKPGRTGKNEGKPKWAEIYDYTSPRYLTVTGHRWAGSAGDVTEQQAALDWLHTLFFAPAPRTPPPDKPQEKQDSRPLDLDDREVVRRAEGSKNGAKFRRLMAGDASGYPGADGEPDHSAADLALCSMLAFWCRGDGIQIDRIFRASGLMRDKWDKVHGGTTGATYGQMTIVAALKSCRRFYDPQPVPRHGAPDGSSGSSSAESRPAGGGEDRGPGEVAEGVDGRPEVRIGGDKLVSAMQAAERVLFEGNDPPFFERGGVLTRISYVDRIRDRKDERIVDRGTLALSMVTPGWLRRRMMQSCRFVSFSPREKSWHPVNLPKDYAESYIDGGEWWAPVLRSVVHAPVIRADGTILHKPGYDPASGLYLDSGVQWKLPPERKQGEIIDPATDSAIAWARDLFIDVFEPFSPETPEDFAVLVAAVITGLMKTEIGPSPGVVITAPVFGSGKGKLADIISIVTTGHIAPMITMPMTQKGKGDEIEFKKSLFSMQLAGSRIICIDEVKGSLVSSALDSALTQEETTDRVLSQSKMATVRPADSLYMALGNNITVPADSSRRWLRGYLNPNCADPHLRSFPRDALLHARDHRVKLVCAALTLLHGYMHAGCPDMGCRLGSFERWAALVPSALVWAKLADPVKTLEAWRELDQGRGVLGALMDAWYVRYKRPDRDETDPITAGELCQAMNEHGANELNRRLAESLKEVCGESKGLNSNRLGIYLRKEGKRVVEATNEEADEKRFYRFELGERKKAGALMWKVVRLRA